MTGSPVRIGARGSPLSLTQTGHVKAALEAACAGERFEIVPIRTTGDRIQDQPLNAFGGKGLFTKELDEALLDGRIDLAVHSMKDLPTELPEGLELGAVPRREDPRDVLISRHGARALAELPPGARVGTASLRRGAQILAVRPDLVIGMLRGNVETRLARVAAGDFDATLLAAAGLNRLGRGADAGARLSPEECLPAVGQGALAITCRRGDARVRALLDEVEDRTARLETTAERAFLKALDGSCRTPIAAFARVADGEISMTGEALTPDGRRRWIRRGRTPLHEGGAEGARRAAEALGRRLGEEIRAEAGGALEFSAPDEAPPP